MSYARAGGHAAVAILLTAATPTWGQAVTLTPGLDARPRAEQDWQADALTIRVRTGAYYRFGGDRLVRRHGETADLLAGARWRGSTASAGMDSVTRQNAAMVGQATAAAPSLWPETDELARQVARVEGAEDRHAERRAPTPDPVHRMQARAAEAGRRLARPAPRTRANAAPAVDDGWSAF